MSKHSRCTKARPSVASSLPGRCRGDQTKFDIVQADFLRNCSDAYCPLTPTPRSTIDLDFSPGGHLLASSQCASLAAAASLFVSLA